MALGKQRKRSRKASKPKGERKSSKKQSKGRGSRKGSKKVSRLKTYYEIVKNI